MPAWTRPTIACVALLAALVAFVAGYLLVRDRALGPPPPLSLVWPPAPPLDPFVLVDARGAAYDEQTLRGRWTLLLFGYTQCPEPCAAPLEAVVQAHARLREQAPYARNGQVLFVSVDGERDTPAVLAAYLDRYGADIVGVSGTAAALHLLSRQFGVRIVRMSGADPHEFWFEHPLAIYLVDPALRVVGMFEPPYDAATLAREIAEVLVFLQRHD